MNAHYLLQINQDYCVAFNAKDVPSKYSVKTSIREYFARAKCVLDIYLLHTSPKFLGEKIKI